MIRFGLVGLGYWGPNLVRNLSNLRDCKVTALCDLNPRRLADYREQFPDVKGTTDIDEVLDPNVCDAVVIATPTGTHFELGRKALERGLHTFVEKPLATSSQECQELIALAESRDKQLFVGHVFLYSSPVLKLKEMVTNGDLGNLYYISSARRNLGPVRRDVSALWDLAPHDISIMLELMEGLPLTVSCSGLAHLNKDVHDVCSLSMRFAENRMGIVHVSWLDPHKKREMTVVGSKKMAVYNDVEPLEKIKIYDNGVEGPRKCESYGDFQFSYRYGDTFSPKLNHVEPLKAECQAFVEAIKSGVPAITDGGNGLDVVRVLEAAHKSLLGDNREVELNLHKANGNGAVSLVAGG